MTNEEFFRRAWLTLKATCKPKTRNLMDEIEMKIEGVNIHKVRPGEKKKDEERIIPL